jgi:hypothetical protein
MAVIADDTVAVCLPPEAARILARLIRAHTVTVHPEVSVAGVA